MLPWLRWPNNDQWSPSPPHWRMAPCSVPRLREVPQLIRVLGPGSNPRPAGAMEGRRCSLHDRCALHSKPAGFLLQNNSSQIQITLNFSTSSHYLWINTLNFWKITFHFSGQLFTSSATLHFSRNLHFMKRILLLQNFTESLFVHLTLHLRNVSRFAIFSGESLRYFFP